MSRINPSYIYLLIEREFIKTNENVYKIGKTKQINYKRFRQYPKGSILLYQSICRDCDISEKILISEFRKKFNNRKDIGAEYFQGDYENMIKLISNILHGSSYKEPSKTLFRRLFWFH